MLPRARRWPVGAELVHEGADVRVWAPGRTCVAVVVADGTDVTLDAEPGDGGYFSGIVPGLRAGGLYQLRIDGGAARLPDPASRFQPEGPHGPSQVVDPLAYAWGDGDWPGVSLPGQVIYELHVGTFTPEGTWAAAADRLGHLRDVGVTLIEMMPVNEFPGRFGWGYDGVDLYAPTRLYGGPDDLRAFVDAAHAHGIGVILDVVYNHFGPDGAALTEVTADYVTDRHANDWGPSINFDGERSGGVRDFFIANAATWIAEYHFDGLRLDATQSLHDDSPEHVVAALGRAARAAAGGRTILLVGENEPQDARFVRPIERGGLGLDALWNDDFHHSALVALTGRNEAYYGDYRGTAQELVSAVKHGFLFQGQYYADQDKARGTPGLDLAPASLVTFLQNHDQVANGPGAHRLDRLTSPGRVRAMTALLLLGPGTPMLFQGQEFGARTPFAYFADHGGDLAKMVREGRRRALAQFPSAADPAVPLADPADPALFAACKLDWSEVARDAGTLALHRDLARLRRADPAFAAPRRGGLDGAVLAPEAFLLRFFAPGDGAGAHGDRLLLVNLGRDLRRRSLAEPLAAPPSGASGWRVLWSSEDPAYGGAGTPPIAEAGWTLPGHAAVVLAPVAERQHDAS